MLTKFPSINSFFNLVQHVKSKSFFDGLDENDKPIYNENKPLPTIKYRGTVKLHGTNCSIVFDMLNHEISYNSKESEITKEMDNHGFVNYYSNYEDNIRKMIIDNLPKLIDDKDINLYDKLYISGEWIGKSNGKGTLALRKLSDVYFVIFTVRWVNSTTGNKRWVNPERFKELKLEEHNILNIYDFPTYDIDINFSNIEPHWEYLSKLTLEVEEMCPFGKQMGVEGIGEGVVFTPVDLDKYDYRYWFKVKGEKHAKGQKPKVDKIIDNEREEYLLSVANELLPLWRLEQGINEIFNNSLIMKEKFSEYFIWINKDIIKECSLFLKEKELTIKDVSKYISKIAKEYLMEEFNNQVLN